VLVTGMGLVRLVMPLVKSDTLPMTPAAMPVMPLTIEAAKFEPGMFGRDIEGLLPPTPGAEAVDGAPMGRGAPAVLCR